jgi:predicted RecB family nuclease
MEIKISAKAFAEFVLGSPSKKASTVRFVLKPQSADAQIVIRYYSRAIQIIRSYHDSDNDPKLLKSKCNELIGKAQTAESQQARTKILNNLRAVETYMEMYGERKWRIVSCPRIYHSSNSVRVSATPDFAIREGKRLRLLKLGVRKEAENPEVIRIMLRVIYQAASVRIDGIQPDDISFFDIAKKQTLHGSKKDAPLARTIDVGCQSLQQMVLGRAA